MKPDPDVDPRGKSPNKKNYTNKCSTKSFKMTLKIIKINKQNIIEVLQKDSYFYSSSSVFT